MDYEWWYKTHRDSRTKILKKSLKVGDRITCERCGGGIGTFIFSHWEGEAICSKDIRTSGVHAVNVLKVNGRHFI